MRHFAEGELNLEPSCGQQMRITAEKTTVNGLGVHPADHFLSQLQMKSWYAHHCRSGKKWERQGLLAAGISTDIQARQISDDNGCSTEFHLFCSGKISLHHEYSVLLPLPH